MRVFLTRRRSLSNRSALPARESGTLFVHKVMSVELSKRKGGRGKVAMHSISEDDFTRENQSGLGVQRIEQLAAKRNCQRRHRLPAAPDRAPRRRPPQRHRIRTDDITHTVADRVAGKGNGETSPRRGDTPLVRRRRRRCDARAENAERTRPRRRRTRRPHLGARTRTRTETGRGRGRDGDGDADADGAWSVASRHPHASPRMSDFARAKNWRMPSRARRA